MALALVQPIIDFVLSMGPLGIFLGMFLESSFVPIPAEAVLVGFGALGFSAMDVTIYGTLGSTLGAALGYAIGRYGGRPFIDRYGKYMFITEKRLKSVDGWFGRWGGYSVLVSRLIPVIPYKVFSIGGGIVRINFRSFLLWTFIGTIPRSFILATLGNLLYTTQNLLLLAGALAVLIAVPIILSRKKKG